MAEEMAKTWRPQDVEVEMYQSWEEAGLFRADASTDRPRFTISMPPPNITGELHMGHASFALQDLYCRYKRMRGFEVLWQPGTDHAAIATQNVIEKQLAAEGTTKEKLGREAFAVRVEQWYADYGARIVDQMKRLGFTADWSRLRFTMDPAYVRAVRTAFVRLYDEGLIYRGPRIVNWCPRCRSSISDLEVDWREHEATLYHIRYDMADGDGSLTVATVRPETMLADTAVAVNPSDPRYTAFVGRRARLPLVGRELPVIADDYVKVDFGTGALKVTPGHDPNDYEIGRRHNLEILSCIDKDGNMVDAEWVPDTVRTRDVLTARERVVEMLRETDHLVRTESYTHEVGHCDRCGEIIEPLVDEQWWCSMAELAKPAIEAVESGAISFVPAKWAKSYLDWMRNLRDWNVSRQLWLGHRVPVYQCANHPDLDGGTLAFASIDEPDKCPQCGATALVQDPDVLDTWFSSALWPFATLGWPDETADLAAFHPTDMLDTGRDIIYLWVARMIMTDLHFLGRVPFSTVLIHATIQDPEGRRMSKSLGTGLDPLEMVDLYGADAVRAWCIEVGVGRQDVRFDQPRLEAYGRFSNKLWNVARLVLGAAEGVATLETPPAEDLFDRWILSRLDGLTERVTTAMESHDPGDAIVAIYDFAWHELADRYLEAAKPRFRDEPGSPGRVAAVTVALHVLETVSRLVHPFMPFISEAIWQALPAGDAARAPLIARSPEPTWPESRVRREAAFEESMEGLFEVIGQLRDARKEARVQERGQVQVTAHRVTADSSADLVDSPGGREAIGWLAQAQFVDSLEGPPARAFVSRGLEIALAAPAAGAGTDRGGLERQAAAARTEITSLTQRLADERFTGRAPEAIVAREREKLNQASERLAAVEAALVRLEGNV